MSDFAPGWWAVSRRSDGSIEVWFFTDPAHVSHTALIGPNGDQLLYFQSTAEEPFLLRNWSPGYEWRPTAPPDDTWDNDKYGAMAMATMELPKDFPRSRRQPSAQELCGRTGRADACKADGLDCTREIHIARGSRGHVFAKCRNADNAGNRGWRITG